ncbi:unnamed protein product [Durusdinium trenchii]|uniref:Uncharacterized protein n=1 Tax=Durusdinium trenchii TaxID=1381693 RepID=A0ABP0NQP0_9DINO
MSTIPVSDEENFDLLALALFGVNASPSCRTPPHWTDTQYGKSWLICWIPFLPGCVNACGVSCRFSMDVRCTRNVAALSCAVTVNTTGQCPEPAISCKKNMFECVFCSGFCEDSDASP